MSDESEQTTIHQLLPKVMASLGAVAKSGRNQQFNYNFRSIDDVLNAVNPALREHGVSIGLRVLEYGSESFQSRNGGTMTRVVTRLAVDLYGPAGDVRTLEGVGESADAQDKAHMKSMVQAFKYATLLGLAIPTHEDDPDSHNPDTAPAQQQQQQDYTNRAKARIMKLADGDKEFASSLWSAAIAATGIDPNPPLSAEDADKLEITVAEHLGDDDDGKDPAPH